MRSKRKIIILSIIISIVVVASTCLIIYFVNDYLKKQRVEELERLELIATNELKVALKDIPEETMTDIVIPTSTPNGVITCYSSNPEYLNIDGKINRDYESHMVALNFKYKKDKITVSIIKYVKVLKYEKEEQSEFANEYLKSLRGMHIEDKIELKSSIGDVSFVWEYQGDDATLTLVNDIYILELGENLPSNDFVTLNVKVQIMVDNIVEIKNETVTFVVKQININ